MIHLAASVVCNGNVRCSHQKVVVEVVHVFAHPQRILLNADAHLPVTRGLDGEHALVQRKPVGRQV